MKYALLAALAAGSLAGCAGEAPETPAPTRVAHEATVRPDCYTVDLFDPAKFVEPSKEVPEDWRGYVGHWGGAAWDGEWCHDLYVLSVTPGGEVTVIEAHAPYAKWGKPVTAFKRKAQIDEDGHLELDYGKTVVDYWIEDGMLFGLRQEGEAVARRIALVREEA